MSAGIKVYTKDKNLNFLFISKIVLLTIYDRINKEILRCVFCKLFILSRDHLDSTGH